MKPHVNRWTAGTAIFAAIVCCVVAGSLSAVGVPHHGMEVDPSDAAACIGCHDGTIGKNVSVCTVGCNASSSHIINKHYPPAGKIGEFNSPSSVRARGIMLVNDQVVCISCHDLENEEKSHLAVANSGSGLCLVCHVK